ncbi:small fragment nuclease [Neoarius graeffei]|uniref:small fragment nuclease n=1 Tax=Neoarius graeffei TaxID=443677 RepID=UPI00298C4CDA|nr:small fragment nuclease [Neoarius graeffei]
MAALVRVVSCPCRAALFTRVASGLLFRTKRQQEGFNLHPFSHHQTTRVLFSNIQLQNSAEMSVSFSTSSSSSEAMSQRMVWVDLEMTGLDIEKDEIIEMACIITDSDLNIVAEGPNLIINQPDSLLDSMSDWCKEHHGKSGLTQAVRDSKISLQQAEYEFLSFIRQHTPPGQCPLAGNSVHADKKFLDKYMPQFMRHLHYRIIDVSTVKELCRRWFPDMYKHAPQKKASHRALDDIQESIKELKFYRATVFKSEGEEKKRKIVENGESKHAA